MAEFMEVGDLRLGLQVIPPQPIFPPEIIECVLKSLGTVDLVASRLVCQSWNKECLKIGKNRRTDDNLELNGVDQIWKYIDFVKKKRPSLELPLHIRLDVDSENLQGCREGIQFVVHTFGPGCISKLSIRNLYLTTPFDIPIEIVNGLRCLEIQYGRLTRPTTATMDLFPSMSRLSCMPGSKCGDKCRSLFLLRDFPNLEHLEICAWPAGGSPSFIASASPKLMTLSVGSISDSDSVSFLEAVRRKTLQLRKLEIKSFMLTSENRNSESTIPALLSLFCETLESLTIPLTSGDKRLRFRIPRLPALTHLSLPIAKAAIIDFGEFNIHPLSLPSLQSVDLPKGYFLVGIDPFPKVRRVTVSVDAKVNSTSRVVSDSLNYPHKTTAEFVENLRTVFPAARSFGVANVHKGRRSDEPVQELVKVLLQSSMSPQIQEIHLTNCDHNYVGETLFDKNKTCLDFRFHASTVGNLTGLRKLTLEMDSFDWTNENRRQCPTTTTGFKLKFSKDFGNAWKRLGGQAAQTEIAKSTPSQSELYLSVIAERCPNLEELEISRIFLGENLGRSLAEIRTYIAAQFPRGRVVVLIR